MRERSTDVIVKSDQNEAGHQGALEKITQEDQRNYQPHSQRKLDSENEITEEFPGNENWENDYVIQKSEEMGDGTIEDVLENSREEIKGD
jgi:hypothetical protein